MADTRFDGRVQTRFGTDVDQGLRSYMLGVYNYMALGVAVTAIISLASYTIPAVGSVTNALSLPAMLVALGLGFFGQRLILNGSTTSAHAAFWGYVAALGIGIAPLVRHYLGLDPSIVANAFFSAALTFGGMSLWGYTSKRDLSGVGAIAGMALMGLIVAALVNMVVALFMGATGTFMFISMLISFGFVIFVSLLTAWETQAIKEMYVEGDATAVATQKSVFGAFILYGSFISIFVNLLQILGFMRSE